MAFVFRLERVLVVRCLQEDAAQQRHAAALEELREAERRLGELRTGLVATLDALDDVKRRDELTVEALHLHSLHVAGLRRAIHVARVDVQHGSAKAEQTGKELLEAHRAREALEKLRERELEGWQKAQVQRERKQLDEIAVSRHRFREEENHGP